MRASLTALLLVAGCEGGVPVTLGATSQSQGVVGGVDDPGDPAVVAFLAAGAPFCSGTLVGPTAVLTAGHCANGLGSVPYSVAFGSDAAHPTLAVPVSDQVLHPQYTVEGAPYDFALLHLVQPVTDVSPVPLSLQALTASDVGQLIRHVGFGVSDPAAGTGSGTKRTASYPITEVDTYVVWSGGQGEQTCTGDSGGPGLLARDGGEVLAGVVSSGPDCYDAGWDGRVDVVASWVTATIAPWTPDAGISSDAGPASPAEHGGGCSTAGGDWTLRTAALCLMALGTRRRRTSRSAMLPASSA
jgi:hypothetical protein